jgi:endonuclease/exonuclease/phosphatase family metal-dependent hydrolase
MALQKARLVLVALALSVACQVLADEIIFMSINTEFFWDELEPHEGNAALGAIGNPPTKREVELKAWAIAHIIADANADVVALVEVENRDVAERIIGHLGNEWSVGFSQGRDTATGQDVALLTKHSIVSGSETSFPDIFGNAPGAVNVRPSKVLGVDVEIDGEDYLFVVAHFLSKRSSANDARRHAQADAVRLAVLGRMGSVDHVVIMGDLNDTPGSDPLNRIQGFDDNQPDFIQTARVGGSNPSFSFIFNNNPELIDHILLSPSLESAFQAIPSNQRHKNVDIGPVSDHFPVIVKIDTS